MSGWWGWVLLGAIAWFGIVFFLILMLYGSKRGEQDYDE